MIFIRRKYGSLKKVISVSPKILIESFAILLIAFLVKYLNSSKNYSSEIGVEILLISLIFSRLLPVFQLIFTSWSTIKVHSYSVLKLKEFYEENHTHENIKVFNNEIKKFDKLEILNLSHEYKDKKVFEKINLEIRKGEWIGICGNSGSGKSTLIDLMMGLLKPTRGKIMINNKDINKSDLHLAWRKLIAHCPPENYLMDADIISNIKPIYDKKFRL